MKRINNIEEYFEEDRQFKDGLNLLREIVNRTELEEVVKWGAPVYTLNNKNVLGIMAFKKHFGIWFFNGAFMNDPLGVMEAAQDNTRGLRHWKFHSEKDIDHAAVLLYIKEAIANQKKGLVLAPKKKKKTAVPKLLKEALESQINLKKSFEGFSPYKQREFCDYIESAKQEKTKLTRLEKILPMIDSGIGLNDKYRK